MNILYCCDEYPPARNGGIGTVVKLVAEAMSRRGHRVVVAGKYWKGNGRKTIEQINGVTVIRFHKRSYKSLTLMLFNLFKSERNKQRKAQWIYSKTRRLLERIVNQYSIDVIEMPDYVDDFIHFNGLKSESWNCFVPKIIRVHGSVSFLNHFLKGEQSERKIEQDRMYFGQADAICAVSAFSRDFVKDYICPERDVDVIYNPIEERWFKQTLDDQESQTILFFGKIAKMKGVLSLIKAFNLVAKEFPFVKLKLIGNGDTEQVKELVEPSISERVIFSGFMPQEHIMEEIDRSLFCVLPSYFENFSMAALEVLARHKALIYTNRASGNELIEDGVNGLLVDPDNSMQIAERMRLLLSDTDLRTRLADKGYEMCRKRFSTEVIIPQIESYYKELIAKCKQ